MPHALRLTPLLIKGSNASSRAFAFSNTGYEYKSNDQCKDYWTHTQMLKRVSCFHL